MTGPCLIIRQVVSRFGFYRDLKTRIFVFIDDEWNLKFCSADTLVKLSEVVYPWAVLVLPEIASLYPIQRLFQRN